MGKKKAKDIANSLKKSYRCDVAVGIVFVLRVISKKIEQ